jgi:DNA-binding response OmpR family regulator
MRVLLVEDDTLIGRSLVRAFRDTGDAVDWVCTGPDALLALRASHYSAVLLDLGLPGRSGLDVLKQIRGERDLTPVLIVTARDDVEIRVAGLDGGADDFIIKPFDFDDLSARLRAVVRRHAGHAASQIRSAEITLDLASHEASYRGTTEVLPQREFALLHALMQRPGTILSRGQLEEAIYGWGEEIESNAIDVLIHYLRRRFDKEVIRNVRGSGWMVPK